MTWPDDGGPRFVVDALPSVRVLDRAYAYRVIREWDSGLRRLLLVGAAALAAELNAQDDVEDAA